MDGQGTTWRKNIAENFNRLSRAHQRYRRQTTDRPSMTNSEHELEFTFAKNELTKYSKHLNTLFLHQHAYRTSIFIYSHSARKLAQ